MTTKRTDISVWIVLLWSVLGLLLWAVLAVCCGNVWAAPASCQYPKTNLEKNGSGIGGAGAIAKGSGIGGTGVRTDADEKLLRVAGNVIASSGNVVASQNGKKRRLAKSDAVCVGETLATSSTGVRGSGCWMADWLKSATGQESGSTPLILANLPRKA